MEKRLAARTSLGRALAGNGCAERFVRILKENVLWVEDFSTVEELRKALLDFKSIFKDNWMP